MRFAFISLLTLIGGLGFFFVANGKAAPQEEQKNVPALTAPLADAGALLKVESLQADDIAITIYRDNLAFLTETRTVDVPKGRSTISFAGVSDLIIPQTAILREFGAVSLERNFDYDLLSQGALFKKSIGKKVYITRTNPASGEPIEEEATIISAGRGVVLDIDGRLETFDCSGLPEKISFDDLPDSLRAEPTLSIEVFATESGPQTFTISYLASGFDWQADYILRLADDEGKADLSGWLTVTNGTALSIKEAPTAIVAGELQRLYETRATPVNADYFTAACWQRGSTKTGTRRDEFNAPSSRKRRAQFEDAPVSVLLEPEPFATRGFASVDTAPAEAKREDLGDYKLFRTPEPTTVAAYQTKQVSFLNKKDIDITRIHAFERQPWQARESSRSGSPDIMNATLRYDIDNEKDGTLGEPLPAGTVRVMSNAGRAETFYLGEGSVRDLAVGLPVEVEIAQSPSVLLETTIVNATTTRLEDRSSRRYTAQVNHLVKNANSYPVLVEISEDKQGYSGPVKITRSSKSQQEDSAYPKWQMTVPPYGEETLSYTMEWTN